MLQFPLGRSAIPTTPQVEASVDALMGNCLRALDMSQGFSSGLVRVIIGGVGPSEVYHVM